MSDSRQVNTGVRQPAPRMAKPEVHAAAPALGWYTDDVLFGENWERPELCKRDRSLVTVAALITCSYTAQMVGHFGRALTNGVRPSEIAETITHLAFYAGWPCAMSAVAVMQQVFASSGVGLDQVSPSTSATMPLRQPLTAQQAQSAAPALEEFSQRVLERDLWLRTELTPRDRSLVTIVCLITQSQPEQLAEQLRLGLANGLTRVEIAETVTHLAFYAGWPRARAALPVLTAVFAESGVA